MMQPRLGATWAYNGKDTVYASYATYNPAASSLPRAASWDRNVFVTLNAYFDQNGVLIGTDPLGVVFGQAVRPGPDAAHDLRDTGRHVEAVQPALVGPALWPVPQRQALLGGHEQHRAAVVGAGRLQSAGRHSARAVHPEPRPAARADRQHLSRPGLSGSSYVIAELDGAFTKYYEGTLETEWRNDKAFVRGLVHLEPLLRELRPGQLRRHATTRTSSSAPRTSATARGVSCGTTATATSAAIAATCSRSTAITRCRGMRPPAFTASRSRVSHGRRGATSRTSRSRRAPATRPDSPSRPARGTLRRTGRSI